jgi:hypothetical protein
LIVDDSIKRFAEEAERIRQMADSLDVGKKLRELQAPMEQLSQHLASLPQFELPQLPKLELPPIPELRHIPTFEENNEFQSAGVLLRRLAKAVAAWRAQLPADVQPAIVAILHGGIQLSVESLSQESFHGIRIEGRLNGSPYVVLAHQATVQLLCFVQPVAPPEHPRRPIGFVIDGEAFDA